MLLTFVNSYSGIHRIRGDVVVVVAFKQCMGGSAGGLVECGFDGFGFRLYPFCAFHLRRDGVDMLNGVIQLILQCVPFGCHHFKV